MNGTLNENRTYMTTAINFCVFVLLVLCSPFAVSQEPGKSMAPDLDGRWDSVGWFGGFDQSPYGLPTFNAAGEAQKLAYTDETDNPVYDCIGPGVPNVLVVPYMIEISQEENRVTIHHEYFDTIRTVHLDQQDWPTDVERTIHGYSRGHYDGASLVVETRNFAFDRIGTDMNGGPTGEQKKVIERFTRSEDGQLLHVEFIIEDPEFLAAPYVREREYRYAPDLELYEFACEPEFAGKTRDMYKD
jgi:hypothetical protein